MSVTRILPCFLFLAFAWQATPSPVQQVWPYDPAEKYSSYWYEKGVKDITNGLRLRHRELRAKNVILFIGDGMGINTQTAARILKGQRNGRSGEDGSLFFQTLPFVSLVKTYNVDRQVPDSAGTATAFLTGVKGNYETIGVNAHVSAQEKNCSLVRENSVPSILKWAVDAGKYAGLVTTTRVTHATPAASYAHSSFRDWENDAQLPSVVADQGCKDIARQLVEDYPGRELRVVLGGGRKHFLPSSFVDPASNWSGGRKDESLIEKWIKNKKAAGLQSHQFKWVNSTKGLTDKSLEQVEYLFGLFNYSHMAFEEERDQSPDGEPSLQEMTTAAIKLLRKGSKGFVLLVEGGRIDHAHHMNLAGVALRETLALDQAVEAAVKLVDLEETLVVVTSDHAHTLTLNGYPVRGQDILGSSGDKDSGGVAFDTLMYGNGPGHREPAAGQRVGRAHQSAVHLNESHHSGEDVVAYGDGPFAHLFQGLVDQTFVAHVISFAACIGNYGRATHCVASASSPQVCLTPLLLCLSLSLALLLIMIPGDETF